MTNVYQSHLDRSPDVEGFAFWTTYLGRGADRGEFIAQITASDEYKHRRTP